MSAESKPVLEFSAAIGERHFTVAEIAMAWSLSPDKVRRLFELEPGVLVFRNKVLGSKRRYTTLRIPESVAERVYRRCLNRIELDRARA